MLTKTPTAIIAFARFEHARMRSQRHAMSECLRVTMDGEILVTGWSAPWAEDDDSEDSDIGPEYECTFAYRNAAWVAVANLGDPADFDAAWPATRQHVRERILLG